MAILIRISVLIILIILLSIQGSTILEQKNLIQPRQTQLKKQESSLNLSLDPDFGNIPLYFIPNEGQVDEKAQFYAKASRYTLWLTKEGLIFDSTRRIKSNSTNTERQESIEECNLEDFTFERDVSRLVFIDANKNPEIIPLDQNEHKVNYFLGSGQPKWRKNIQTSRAVLYRELFPRIDLKVHGIEKQVEYDFIVKPGGVPSDIRFLYENIEKTRIDKEGNLEIKTNFGELEHAKPVCYQVIEGERVKINAEFKRIKNNTFGFEVEGYNINYRLIIDPLIYSTYLGGSSAEEVSGIAVDLMGSVYVTGRTWSADFPTQNPIQGSKLGAQDVFITKLNASGTALVYSTYLGGSDIENGLGIAVDSAGAAYVAGWTWSADFPAQNPIQGSSGGESDVFITKINASGSALIYSTYLGGSDRERFQGIAVDSEGAAYVAGSTYSADFPTQNPIMGTYAGDEDVFITKINAAGNALIYSTYLGGSGRERTPSIAVDSEGEACVTGRTESVDFPTHNPIQSVHADEGKNFDVFITKINASGSAFVYSTYLGGSGGDIVDDIGVDSEGAAYVTGGTGSVDFPTQNPIQGNHAEGADAFITKVNASGSTLVYSTYLGGSADDHGGGIAVDSEGAVYVTGSTASLDFPTQEPIQGTNAGMNDVFIAKVNAPGTDLMYSTYLGGSGGDYGEGIAVDSAGAAYVTGWTWSADFPTQNPIQGSPAGNVENEGEAFITNLVSSDITTYTLSLAAGGGGTTNPEPGTYTYMEGKGVAVEAIPNSGYTFSGWSGDASGTTNPITITMDSNKSITASFAKVPSDDDGGGGGGCFIATACFGTPMAEEVKTLSVFRDRYLITNPIGVSLVKLYCTLSPMVADFIRDKEALKTIIRACLKPVVWIISMYVK